MATNATFSSVSLAMMVALVPARSDGAYNGGSAAASTGAQSVSIAQQTRSADAPDSDQTADNMRGESSQDAAGPSAGGAKTVVKNGVVIVYHITSDAADRADTAAEDENVDRPAQAATESGSRLIPVWVLSYKARYDPEAWARSVYEDPRWTYHRSSFEYHPKRFQDYRPKEDWTYRPRQRWDYQPKRDWSYHRR